MSNYRKKLVVNPGVHDRAKKIFDPANGKRESHKWALPVLLKLVASSD